MTLTWRDLLVETIRSPERAAETVLSFQMTRQDVWLSVAAVAAINAVFSGVLSLLATPTRADGAALPGIAIAPLSQALLIAGLIVLLAYVVTWVGRAFGGVGEPGDMLKLMVWMQFVGMVLQAANMVVLFAVPSLGALLVIAVFLILLRTLLSFVKVGHSFDGFGTAAFALFASLVGMVLGLSVILGLLGYGTI